MVYSEHSVVLTVMETVGSKLREAGLNIIPVPEGWRDRVVREEVIPGQKGI